MKYSYWHQDYSELFTNEQIDAANAERKEDVRIDAWHTTFNAALTAFLTVLESMDAIDYAKKVADKVHGEI